MRRSIPPAHPVHPVLKGTTLLDLDNLLRESVRQEASDVHIKVGSPPFLRVDGHLTAWECEPVTPADTERIAFALLPKARADEFLDHHEADFAYTLAGLGRFRVNVFRQRGSVGLVLRRVLPGIPSMEDLGLPPIVRRLAGCDPLGTSAARIRGALKPGPKPWVRRS